MKAAPAYMAAFIAFQIAGCEREARRLDTPATPTLESVAPTPVIHAGPPVKAAGLAQARKAETPLHPPEENAYAVSQGKRLFRWYNCNGCHGAGGGGMGPPLMDDQWLYGGEPAQIVATIVEGRVNGMPSFAGRIPEDQLWQLAAYVRSMSGLVRGDVASGRNDGLTTGKPEQSRKPRETPRTLSSTREP
jgi:cytochrome c oxidase cbb3-type subunit 3